MGIREQEIAKQVEKRLAELLDAPVTDSQLATSFQLQSGQHAMADVVIQAGPYTFLVEAKASPNSRSIADAIEQVRRYSYSNYWESNAIPIVAVPFMGEVGQKLCREAGVGWLDLSGNAAITAPGLRIFIFGYPNRFKYPGRPSSIFAPKSARIARWLLMHPESPISTGEIANATGVDKGLTSRILQRLEKQGYITRDNHGLVQLREPHLLLDAWREAYDFSKHQVLRGNIPARSGISLLQQLADAFQKANMEYAATGLAAAWQMDHYAGFRLVTLYLQENPGPKLLDDISFREDPRGANTWLVLPSDEGVFQGTEEHEGICCVHPVQVYLDLKDQPERSDEAAIHLRNKTLRNIYHAG